MKIVDPFNQLVMEAVDGVRALTVGALMTAVLVSFGVLAFFRRRVRRSITSKAPSTSPMGPTQDSALSASDRAITPPIVWSTLNHTATRHRAGLARVYIFGGVGLAIALAGVAIANVDQARFSLLWFFFAAACFSMPLAVTIRLLYGRWKPSFKLVAGQLVAVYGLSPFVPEADGGPALALAVSPLLALLLHPRIRAMGALATGFFTVVFTGALLSVATSLFLMRDSIKDNILADPRVAEFKRAVEASDETNARWALFTLAGDSSFWRDQGLFILQTISVLVLVGLLAAVALGFLLFFFMTRSYARKRFSEQSLLIASVWLFVAIAAAPPVSLIGLSANLACIAVFGFGVAAAWRRLPHDGPCVRLLLLRSFTLGERSNRLFQDLESLWRSIGSIQLVGAVDLALTTLEPHELMGFLSGRSGREFVHSPADVEARLALFDHTRDPDGRFRVNVLFCGDDLTWKYAVNRMLMDSECVHMDLRGFSRHRAGLVFEIRSLAESHLPFRAVFLVDELTDQKFVRETWAAAKGTAGGVNRDAFAFVSEEPFDGTVSNRIITAFSSSEPSVGVAS